MKLIIQIPCLNEEDSLPVTLAELPHEIAGIDTIEWLIIDDGSTDRTSEIAKLNGVHHIVKHRVNRGLATAFQSGINACLELGADIIVNTDADNQYPGRYIAQLIEPILAGSAEMVIGNRQTHTIEHFSPAKKLLQNLGSRVVRFISGTDVPDAPSGFRAFSREAALRLHVLTSYTYTLETIIQAGKMNLAIAHIPITTNPKMRESRLIRNMFQYIARSALTLLRLFLLYEPLKTFIYVSVPFFLLGGLLWLRYLILTLAEETTRGSNVQSIIVGAAFIMIGFLIMTIGMLGEVIAANRRLHEETLYYLKRTLLSKQPLSNQPKEFERDHALQAEPSEKIE